MVEYRNTQDVRQGERGMRTFVVLIVSATIAALIAIGGYFYVFSEDDRDLQGAVPSTGTIEAPAETTPPVQPAQ
ncbi:hypothetical protein DLJ53_15255 [Acuticoccus sediminis]|uniref:Uncharacterized protein n=1 Tax=Acuticoccus sediminis TaxID=2184697 RepID=A0A8B2NTX2_9HYPH|nr:hypothetical protein [Acuticoccus sediminis]RAI00613.1 hypothetical protein DLJ53_15255 [Acuticoccus sediminis]